MTLFKVQLSFLNFPSRDIYFTQSDTGRQFHHYTIKAWYSQLFVFVTKLKICRLKLRNIAILPINLIMLIAMWRPGIVCSWYFLCYQYLKTRHVVSILHPGSAIHWNHEAETIEPLNRQCPLVPRFSDGYNRKPKVKQTLYSAANTTNTCFKLGALWISELAIVCFVLIFQFSFFQNIETVPDQATHYRRSDLPGTYRIEY